MPHFPNEEMENGISLFHKRMAGGYHHLGIKVRSRLTVAATAASS